MTDQEDERGESAPRVGEIRFSAKFEPNTLIYDADTASPPRLRDASGPVRGPVSTPADANVGGHVAHFRLVSKIGAGGMGVVYRATDEYLQRQVALKVLNLGKGDADDVENTQRLLREARAASRISHPNVVTVFAAGEHEGVAFIAMEFVEGQELGRLIGSRGLDTDRALGIAAQVAEGLDAAHAQGIVHRDVKPANVLVSDGDRVKILDFGLAKPGQARDIGSPRTSARSAEELPDSIDALDFYNTQAGVIWGSLRYMSPEQFTGDRVDARSDVFSLGILLYQMLTGVLPFVANKPREQFAALLNQTPPPLKQFRLRIPDMVQAIVDRALARDRDMRYPSGGALAADLRTAARRLSELGDVEIEDAAHGSRRLSTTAALAEGPAGGTTNEPRQVTFGTDSVTLFPDGAQFDAVILSPNVYPWLPRGSRLPGGGAGGTTIMLLGQIYEVVAADQQHSKLNRYFLYRWSDTSIVRRVFDYTPEVVAEHAAARESQRPDRTTPARGSVISNLFGRRRKET